jgi:DNA-binding transcriptional regulator YdaS (Cro superfamily)
MRTLRRAMQSCGGEAGLAKKLGVPPESLSSWLAGKQVLPVDAYLRALGIVSLGR